MDFKTVSMHRGNPDVLFFLPDMEFGLQKIRASLRANSIVYLGQLLNHTREDLLKSPNFGEKTVAELENFLDKHNYKLRDPDSSPVRLPTHKQMPHEIRSVASIVWEPSCSNKTIQQKKVILCTLKMAVALAYDVDPAAHPHIQAPKNNRGISALFEANGVHPLSHTGRTMHPKDDTPRPKTLERAP